MAALTNPVHESGALPRSDLQRRARRVAGTVLGRPTPMIEPGVEEYAERHTSRESADLVAVADDTRRLTDQSYMMSGAPQAHFLATLVRLGQSRNVLEIGTFTGYAALAMAAELPADGRITTCELSTRHAAIAAVHFAASPYAPRIDLRVGPALPAIEALPGPFDLVFIDADKGGYLGYLEAVLPKLAPHGVIAVDNTLHNGLTPRDEVDRAMLRDLHTFNAAVEQDPRIDQVVLTVRDGLTLIRHAR